MNPAFFCFIDFSKLLLSIMMFALLFDIGGGFGLKYLAISLVFLFFLLRLPSFSFPKSYFFDFFLFVVFVSISLLSAIRGNQLTPAISEISFLFFLILLVVGKGVGSDFYTNIFVKISLFGSFFIASIYFAIIIFPEVALSWARTAQDNRLGYLGLNPIVIGLPNVYFRWSAWLVLGFSLCVFNRKFFFSGLILFSSFLTMSSAIIIGQVLVVFAYIIFGVRSSIKTLFYSVVVILMALGFFYFLKSNFASIYELVFSKLNSGSESTGVKIGHIYSIVSLLWSNPEYLIFGQGPGTPFYSEGVQAIVSNVEVSHFDLLRQFGLLGFLSFFMYFIFVLVRLLPLGNTGHAWIVGLFVMFMVAGTNPLLLSPIFFIPLIFARLFEIERSR